MGKLATALLLTATALAAGTSSATAQAPGAVGGLAAGEPPAISGVSCRAACAGLQRVHAGSLVRLTGRAMAGAGAVVFLGGRGVRDNVTARPQSAADDAVRSSSPPARAAAGCV